MRELHRSLSYLTTALPLPLFAFEWHRGKGLNRRAGVSASELCKNGLSQDSRVIDEYEYMLVETSVSIQLNFAGV
jgi:hypothetical protein